MGPDDELGQESGPSAGGPSRREQAARARESAERWLGQLQDMIDQAGRQAAPLLRDVAAKAAELAAVAAENAGPVAHKAANVTEHVGDRLAARSKELAADLRKAAEAARTPTAPDGEPGDTPLEGEEKPLDADQA
jgi:ABC-type transporter Mla subunit MlaD